MSSTPHNDLASKAVTASEPKKNNSTAEPEEYSAEDDAKLLELKTEGKTWNQILEALGKKSKSRCQARFKEIAKRKTEDKKEEINTKEDGREKRGEQKQKQEDFKAKADANRAAGLAKQAEAKAQKTGKKDQVSYITPSTGTGMHDLGGSMDRTIVCITDAFDYKETASQKAADASADNDLKTFVHRYERDKWLAAASRHYDLTGIRISPETAKRRAGQ